MVQEVPQEGASFRVTRRSLYSCCRRKHVLVPQPEVFSSALRKWSFVWHRKKLLLVRQEACCAKRTSFSLRHKKLFLATQEGDFFLWHYQLSNFHSMAWDPFEGTRDWTLSCVYKQFNQSKTVISYARCVNDWTKQFWYVQRLNESIWLSRWQLS